MAEFRDEPSYQRGILDGGAMAADVIAGLDAKIAAFEVETARLRQVCIATNAELDRTRVHLEYMVHRARAIEGPDWAGDCLTCIELDQLVGQQP